MALALLPSRVPAATRRRRAEHVDRARPGATVGPRRGCHATPTPQIGGQGRIRRPRAGSAVRIVPAEMTPDQWRGRVVHREPARAPENLRCSFCGKRRDEVEGVVAGGHRAEVVICNECVDLCAEILAEERASREPPPSAPAGP